MTKKLWVLAIVSLFITGMGERPKIDQGPSVSNPKNVTLSGKLRQVGSMPFTQYVLETPTEDIQIYIRESQLKDDLHPLVGKNVTLSGILHIQKMQVSPNATELKTYSIELKKIVP